MTLTIEQRQLRNTPGPVCRMTLQMPVKIKEAIKEIATHEGKSQSLIITELLSEGLQKRKHQ